MIKLILADDHKLVREGLKAILETPKDTFKIVGEAATGQELITLLATCEPDVIIMDIKMPEMNGTKATQYIKAHFPHIKVLILSMLEHEKYVIQAFHAGADGFTLKTTGQQELTNAIQKVAQGEAYINTAFAIKLLKNIPVTEPVSILMQTTPANNLPLSKRELEVLQLISQGYNNTEIADLLFTSKRTIESHRQNLLEKTGCKNTANLILYASRHQLLQ